jgi:hypothetical protein
MENLIPFEKFGKSQQTEVNEAEGIHPAVRTKLLDYLKENPNATFAEAKNHIGDALKGWKLSEEDFEEAKKLSN